MVRAETIKLIANSERGVFETLSTTATEVQAEARSVRMSEFYTAKNEGLNPEYVFVLPYYHEYHNERIVEWNSVEYKVIRTYSDGQSIELTVERSNP